MLLSSERRKELVQGDTRGKQSSQHLIVDSMTNCPDRSGTGPASALRTLHLGKPLSLGRSWMLVTNSRLSLPPKSICENDSRTLEEKGQNSRRSKCPF